MILLYGGKQKEICASITWLPIKLVIHMLSSRGNDRLIKSDVRHSSCQTFNNNSQNKWKELQLNLWCKLLSLSKIKPYVFFFLSILMNTCLAVTPQPEDPDVSTPVCGSFILPDAGICVFGAIDQATGFKAALILIYSIM